MGKVAVEDEGVEGAPDGIVEAESAAIESHLVDVLRRESVITPFYMAYGVSYGATQPSQQTSHAFILVYDLDAVEDAFV